MSGVLGFLVSFWGSLKNVSPRVSVDPCTTGVLVFLLDPCVLRVLVKSGSMCMFGILVKWGHSVFFRVLIDRESWCVLVK